MPEEWYMEDFNHSFSGVVVELDVDEQLNNKFENESNISNRGR